MYALTHTRDSWINESKAKSTIKATECVAASIRFNEYPIHRTNRIHRLLPINPNQRKTNVDLVDYYHDLAWTYPLRIDPRPRLPDGQLDDISPGLFP